MKISNYFILKDGKIKANCIAAIQSLPHGEYEVRIAKVDKNRTSQQNKLLWGPWYGIFSDYMGQSKEEIHDILKVRLLGVEKRIVEGVELIEPKSTAKLTVEEFNEFLVKVEALAMTMGLTLPAREYHGV